MTTIAILAAGYRYIPAVMRYSGGVAALPGFRLERARFAEPVPMAQRRRRIAAQLASRGRPLAAFNAGYAQVLGEWDVLHEGRNPVARSNVCPRHAPPA